MAAETTAPDAAARALIEAARRGDETSAAKALKGGAKPDATDENGVTPLLAAAYANRVAVAKLLLDAGAGVGRKDRAGLDALLIASSDGFVELLELVRRHGADLGARDPEGSTALIRAAERTQDKAVAVLLLAGADRNAVNRQGRAALHAALIDGLGGDRLYETVRLLIEGGADPNLADANGDTPLALAQRRGLADVVHLLEANGAR